MLRASEESMPQVCGSPLRSRSSLIFTEGAGNHLLVCCELL